MNKIRKMIYTSMYIAIAMVLPFLTGQIPEIGSMLCPLHIPAILCGFTCGWPYGLLCGVVSPILRFVIFTMPPIQSAIPMAFEIGIYGMVSGYLYMKLPKKPSSIYISLISAMIAGRVVWGIVNVIIAGLNMNQFGWTLFISGAFTSALPGITLQLILIPILVRISEKRNTYLNDD